jgi:carbon monoxide dehydrogenase subunit G
MRVRQAVSINAPVDQAFAYLNDPENSLALIPSLVEVREMLRSPTAATACAS